VRPKCSKPFRRTCLTPWCTSHLQGAGRDIVVNMGAELVDRAVHVQNLTDSPFDWIAAFEQASLLAVEDSVHANLIEQLNLMVPKHLFLRSPCSHCPVFKNGWKFR
jgi:hypothetical protein